MPLNRVPRLTLAAVLATAVVCSASPLLAQTGGPSQVQIASEQERQRELAQLGLKDTRPGANNRDPASPLYPNYDEARANPVPLPDPLAGPDGKRAARGSGKGTGLALASS